MPEPQQAYQTFRPSRTMCRAAHLKQRFTGSIAQSADASFSPTSCTPRHPRCARHSKVL